MEPEGKGCETKFEEISKAPKITKDKLPRRYLGVTGYQRRKNDVVYCPPLHEPQEEEILSVDSDSHPVKEAGWKRARTLIFFGGDIQDFKENMEARKDHKQYSCWNLETTAQILQKQFPDHHILVIRPNRVHMHTFSCYENFVNCNTTGDPDHVISHNSLLHLELLLRNLSKRMQNDRGKIHVYIGDELETSCLDEDSIVSSTTTDENGTVRNGASTSNCQVSKNENLHLDRGHISIVGFSKGCVVLNQLLYEFHYLKTLTPEDASMEDFLACIEEMMWLDGGHNGGKIAYITSRSLLETFTRLNIKIRVHMTPYQLSDDRRPWVRKEERTFSDMLKRFGAPIKRYIHFENETPSLTHHMQLIAQFASVERDEETRVENSPDSPS